MIDTSTYTKSFAASDRDVGVIENLIRTVRSIRTPVDSGEALVGLTDRHQPRTTQSSVSTLDFMDEESRGVWVTSANSDPSAAILYLHGRRFEFDEPAELFAPRVAEGTGIPVLKANYRLAPEFPYPAALEDTLAIYRSLLNLGIPGRQIVALSGDGGLSMLMGDLITAIQEKLPIKIAVFDNGSLGFVELCHRDVGATSGSSSRRTSTGRISLRLPGSPHRVLS